MRYIRERRNSTNQRMGLPGGWCELSKYFPPPRPSHAATIKILLCGQGIHRASACRQQVSADPPLAKRIPARQNTKLLLIGPADVMSTSTPLPLSSHGKPVDSFSRAAELEKELARAVKGEVRFDRGSRALYATDGSNYRQIPIGLVVPRDDEDVIATVAACRKYGAPVLPRGAGTSLAGQCCNVAVVLDFTKYMNKILEINPEQRFARVQPGVVLDTLRNKAEEHHLTFGPDPATHSRCTLGGMIGNNSCGPHSLLGGKTVARS